MNGFDSTKRSKGRLCPADEKEVVVTLEIGLGASFHDLDTTAGE